MGLPSVVVASLHTSTCLSTSATSANLQPTGSLPTTSADPISVSSGGGGGGDKYAKDSRVDLFNVEPGSGVGVNEEGAALPQDVYLGSVAGREKQNHETSC